MAEPGFPPPDKKINGNVPFNPHTVPSELSVKEQERIKEMRTLLEEKGIVLEPNIADKEVDTSSVNAPQYGVIGSDPRRSQRELNQLNEKLPKETAPDSSNVPAAVPNESAPEAPIPTPTDDVDSAIREAEKSEQRAIDKRIEATRTASRFGVKTEVREDGFEYINIVPEKSEGTPLEWRDKLRNLITEKLSNITEGASGLFGRSKEYLSTRNGELGSKYLAFRNASLSEKLKTLGKRAVITGEWYRKQPLKYKIALSAALIGTTVAIGGASTLVTLFASTAMVGQRALNALGTYVLVEGLLEKSDAQEEKKGVARTKFDAWTKHGTAATAALAVFSGLPGFAFKEAFDAVGGGEALGWLHNAMNHVVGYHPEAGALATAPTYVSEVPSHAPAPPMPESAVVAPAPAAPEAHTISSAPRPTVETSPHVAPAPHTEAPATAPAYNALEDDDTVVSPYDVTPAPDTSGVALEDQSMNPDNVTPDAESAPVGAETPAPEEMPAPETAPEALPAPETVSEAAPTAAPEAVPVPESVPVPTETPVAESVDSSISPAEEPLSLEQVPQPQTYPTVDVTQGQPEVYTATPETSPSPDSVQTDSTVQPTTPEAPSLLTKVDNVPINPNAPVIYEVQSPKGEIYRGAYGGSDEARFKLIQDFLAKPENQGKSIRWSHTVPSLLGSHIQVDEIGAQTTGGQTAWLPSFFRFGTAPPPPDPVRDMFLRRLSQ